MKKRCARVLAFVLCAVMAVTPVARAAADPGDQVDKLIDLSRLIATYALDNASDDPLYDALVELLGQRPELFDEISHMMTDKLDHYSNLFTEEEYDTYYPTGVAFVGVGVTLDSARDEGLLVQQLFKDGPADKAGLKAGDEILTIDGRNVSSFPPAAAAPLLRGEEGTKVKVTARRKGADKPLSFTITRAQLTATHITYKDMGDGVGYIRIAGFGSLEDFLQFADLYERIPYEGIRSVIIDLRDNPGGDMDVMYNMLNTIVAKKNLLLYALQTATKAVPDFYNSTGAAIWTPNKLVVLVNENTASAAEAFAGALQGNGLAEVVGEKTYGKGRGQFVFRLGEEGDSVAVLTAMEILLPEVVHYDKKGLTPKHVVPLKQVPHPEVKLSALPVTQAVLPSVNSARNAGLEERLSLTGAFLGKPDNTWKDYTTYALNAFQRAHKLKETAYADVDTLKALDKEVKTLLASQVTEDTQLDFALNMAKEAAKKPLAKPLPPTLEEQVKAAGQ